MKGLDYSRFYAGPTMATEMISDLSQRVKGRIDAQVSLRCQGAFALMALASAVMALSFGLQTDGVLRTLSIMMEASAIIIGVAVFRYASSPITDEGLFEAIDELNEGRYNRVVEITINNSMTMLTMHSKSGNMTSQLLKLQTLLTVGGFMLFLGGSI